jgi:competence protein ComEC
VGRDKQFQFEALSRLGGWMKDYLRALPAAMRDDVRARIYWAVVIFGFGIGAYFALPFEPPLAVVVLLPAGLAALWTWCKESPRSRAVIEIGFLLALGIALGAFRASQFKGPLILEELGPVALTGRLVRIEERQGRAVRITLDQIQIPELATEETPERLRITVRTRHERLLPGAMVTTRAILLPLSGPVMPGGYDFARQIWFQGIGGSGFAVGEVRVLKHPESHRWSERLETLRLYIAARIRQRIEGPRGTVAAALLTGMRGGIPEEAEENLRSAGLAHLLAISGLHMALFVGTSFFLFRALLAAIPPIAARYPIKKWAALAAWFVGLCYLFLSGMAISTQRAFIMVSIALLAVLLERRAISMRLVALAAAIILVVQPEALFSPGFQMSFAAVVALVAVYKAVRPFLWRSRRRKSRLLGTLRLYFLGIVLSTLVAEAAIAPFAIFHFNRMALLGIPANLVAMPIMGFWVMPAGLMALFLMPFGLEGLPLAAMGQGLDVILSTAAEISALPGSTLQLSQMPQAALGLLALGGLWLALWQHGRLRLLAVVLFLAGGLVWLSATPPDILIGRDGRLVAIRHWQSGLYYFSSGRAERFSRQAWQRALAQKDYLGFAALERTNAGAGSNSRFACRKEGCVYHWPNGAGRGPVLMALTLRPEGFRLDCRKADLLITPLRAPRDCTGPRLVIDGPYVRQAGGLALWFEENGDIRIQGTNKGRGIRPWVVPTGAR